MTDHLVIKACAAKRAVHFQAGSADRIWADVVSRSDDIEAARILAGAIMGDIRRKKLWAAGWWIATRAAYQASLKFRGRYVAESDYLAGALGDGLLSPADMAGLQRLYTLAHAGCSAVMGWDEDSGRMVHFRCLDWPSAPAIAQASRLYEAVGLDGAPVYGGAGILGLVGCLTAAKPGFSAAINFAPWTGPSLSPNRDPTFLLRELMESPISTYDEARASIGYWRPSAPVFITLCGIRKGEASILAFGADWNRHRGCHVTELGDRPWLVQTNHYDPSGPFAAHNPRPISRPPASEALWDEYSLLQTSEVRKERIEESLSEGGAGLEATLRQAFAQAPVWNHQTAQWVTMIPATGEIRLEVRA